MFPLAKHKTFIIAEAGVNHNGSLDMAKELVIKAAESGADAVKFQTFKAETIATADAKKAEYQEKTTSAGDSQFDMLKQLELSHDMHVELMRCCDEHNILFLSSPFDCESVDYLAGLDLPLFKIPSGEITHVPYLRKIASYNKPTILSTGMCNSDDVQFGVDTLVSAGLDTDKLTLLHCTTEYPCPFTDVNLRVLKTLADTFSVDVGYSDHTEGIAVSLAAVALGATVIEKHFTLDKTLPGPDHKASMNPDELNALVVGIRQIEASLGTAEKVPTDSELKNISIVRKSIVAKKAIQQGDLFSEDNLICKRPATGISSTKWDELIGTHAKQDYARDDLI